MCRWSVIFERPAEGWRVVPWRCGRLRLPRLPPVGGTYMKKSSGSKNISDRISLLLMVSL